MHRHNRIALWFLSLAAAWLGASLCFPLFAQPAPQKIVVKPGLYIDASTVHREGRKGFFVRYLLVFDGTPYDKSYARWYVDVDCVARTRIEHVAPSEWRQVIGGTAQADESEWRRVFDGTAQAGELDAACKLAGAPGPVNTTPKEAVAPTPEQRPVAQLKNPKAGGFRSPLNDYLDSLDSEGSLKEAKADEKNPYDKFVTADLLEKKAEVGDAQAQFSLGTHLLTEFNIFDQTTDGKFFDKPSTEGARVLQATGIVAASVLLAFFCAYILWTVLGKSVKGSTPLATGRRWMNWVAAMGCITLLTKFFSQLLGGYGKPVDTLALAALGIIVWAVSAFGAGALWAYFRKRKPNDAAFVVVPGSAPPAELEGVAPPAVASASQADIGEDRWSHALAEFDGDARRPGLWARAFAEAQGNEAVAKANYLRYRAIELEQEHQALVAADHQRELARVESERIRELQEAQAETRAQSLEARRIYLLLPKGRCPNFKCNAVMPLTSQKCPKCEAVFGEGSVWSVLPLDT